MTSENSIPPNSGRSWWLREALSHDPGEPTPPLKTDTTADVVILGAGYTGMWTAYQLKRLDPGIDVVVLESDICGAGASGRNGGFVNSWWDSLPNLCKHFGDQDALRLARAGEDSVASIGAFCDEHDIDAWFRADGDLGAATSEAQVGDWADTIITAERLGIADQYNLLDRAQIRQIVDSPVMAGGVLNQHGATVHPGRLARGMRRVLLEMGVRIYENTPVTRFGTADPATAETPSGTVRAGQAVIALNAWASNWKRFRKHLIPRGSFIAITAPAPELLADLGWTNGLGIWDYRASLHYFRNTPDGRIALGIAGMQPGLGMTIGPSFAYDERSIGFAVRDLRRIFPSFRDVPIEAAWGGPVDVTGAHVPFFGTLRPGNVHFGLGYTGNGVGPSHLGGQILANRALGRQDPVLDLPIVDMAPDRFPPEPLKSVGAMVINEAIRRRDDAADDGGRANGLTQLVAGLPRRLGYDLG